MLFVGTKNNSETNYFGKFIKSNNGYTNAYTSDDHTCYYYEVANEKILESLDKFVDFFTVPTLSDDSIEKEKEAVNAEHSKNRYSEGRLNYETFKKAINQNSPFSKFSTGCNETLAIDKIGDKIREFYHKHYSANIMTLTVVTNKETNEIKDLLCIKYGEILNKDVQNNPNNDVKFIEKSKFILMKSVSDVDELSLNWNVQSYYYNYTNSPMSFISHLLGYLLVNEKLIFLEHLL
jgi:insulysin